MTTRMAVGSYTRNAGHVPDARGRGISVLEWNGETGTGRILGTWEAGINPSYLAVDSDSSRLYSIGEEENGPSAMRLWKVEKRTLTEIASFPMEGRALCHVSFIQDSGLLTASSYLDGRVMIMDLDDRGRASHRRTLHFRGSGPNSMRQEAPHAHQTVSHPHNGFLYTCDLGCDRVWLHDPSSPEMETKEALVTPGGYGPRHLAFSPDGRRAFVLCELEPWLLEAYVDQITGHLEIREALALPSHGEIKVTAAAAIKIHPSGKTLAVSSRFDDTIAVFSIEESGSPARLVEGFSSRGKTPRDMEFSGDGRWLFVANQDSHNIVTRAFDPFEGVPVEKWGADLDCGSPACIVAL